MDALRRHVLLGAAAWAGLPGWCVAADGRRLRPTPRQAEGPFYPVEIPRDSDADLLRHADHAPYALGTPVWLGGVVLGVDGRPVRDAVVEIWQVDHAGRYHHPGDGGRADPAFQGFGRAEVDAEGRYRFRTLRPSPYSGRTPHIHVKVRQGARELLTTQLYVMGEARNERDFLWRRLDADDRAALTRPFRRSPDGLVADFPIVIAT